MLYKLIAWIVVLIVILVPLIFIILGGFYITWWSLFLLPVHLFLVQSFFRIVSRLNDRFKLEGISSGGGNEKMNMGEKVVTKLESTKKND